MDVSLPPRRYRFLARLLAVALERSGSEPATALLSGLGSDALRVELSPDPSRCCVLF